MKPRILPEHPAFSRLGAAERKALLDASELWEAPAGARLFHPGDSAEDLILLLGGRLEMEGPARRRWFQGDLWGEDRLTRPQPLEHALVSAEKTCWLRWERATLSEIAALSPRIRRKLEPLRRNDGVLLSGLIEGLPFAGGSSSRRFRRTWKTVLPGLVIAVAGMGLLALAASALHLPRQTVFIAPAAYLGWLMVFFFHRRFTEFEIDAAAVTSRFFDWSRFGVESRHVPVDRIQGVETESKGLIRRVFGYGTVVIKTSAAEGALVLGDVDGPERIRLEIADLCRTGVKRVRGREREDMRRNLEKGRSGSPRMLCAAEGGNRNRGKPEVQFRKTPAVLLPRFAPALAIMALLLFLPRIVARPLPSPLLLTAALLSVLWCLYHFRDWYNHLFKIGGESVVIIHRKPLGLHVSRKEVKLSSLQNIRTEQIGPLAILLRFGNVVLVGAGGENTVFPNIAQPWKAQQTLMRCRDEAARRRADSDAAVRREELSRFAEALNQIQNTEASVS